MNVYLTALVKCKANTVLQMKVFLDELVKASNAEPACLQYELYQSTTDETQFIFHETWVDQAGLDQHNQQPHFKKFGEQIADIVDGKVIIHITERIG